MPDGRKTDPALRVVRPSVPPINATPGREPTNAELGQQMVSLGTAFDTHRAEDRAGFDKVLSATRWQTFILAVITAIVAGIFEALHH